MMHASESVVKKPNPLGWIPKVLIFALSLFIFMEGGARLALSVGPLRRRITGFDDPSYRLQWIKLHQIHQEWTGQYATFHPVRGWTLKPDIKDLRVFDGKILNSNSRGFRGKTEYDPERTPGKRRIIVLGDSFTFGEEVSDDETYSHDLESELPNTEVLNLGVQGYGHDQMLLYLKEEGIKYHPDVVIVGFAYLDVYRNLWTFFAYAKPKFKLASDKLELTNVPVPAPDHVLAQEPYRLKSFDLLEMLREKLRWSTGKNETQARNLTHSILDEIIATTRGIGAVPVFVYLPVYEEITPLPKSSYPLTAMSPPVPDREQFLRDICHEQGIPCLFLRPRFLEEVKKGADFNAKGHWNSQAHLLAAQEMKDFLLKNNLIQNMDRDPSPN